MDGYMNLINELAFMDEKLDTIVDTINTMSKRIDELAEENEVMKNERLITKLMNMTTRVSRMSDEELLKVDEEFERAISACDNKEKQQVLCFKHQRIIREILDRNFNAL